MYMTITIWIEAGGRKLDFQSSYIDDDPWLRVGDGKHGGDVSFHFDADGLRQFIFALEGLERDVIEKAKEEVKIK